MTTALRHGFALFCGSLAVLCLDAAEPVYEGKSANFWLDHCFSSPNGMQESITAFKAMGSNSVPFLIEVLERKTSVIGEAVDNALYHQELARKVPHVAL